ncbi:MAG: NAD(+) synthase [Lentisphaeria bacterium]|nr:NAD(+) synthase [Lentisphaeria bacterium]
MFNIYRIAAVSPDLHPADIRFNVSAMSRAYTQAVNNHASLVLFPALAVTGKSCGILFEQPYLLDSAWEAAISLAAVTGDAPAVFGMPVYSGNKLVECAAVAQNGKIAALIVRRTPDLPGFSQEIPVAEGLYPAGTVFNDGKLTFSVNFAGDMPVFPAAQLQLFCGAKPAIPGAWECDEEFFRAVSNRSGGAAAAAFSGCGESTGDVVYGGGLLICDRGKTAASRPSPANGSGMIYADIDLDKINHSQMRLPLTSADRVRLQPVPQAPDFSCLNNPIHPFLPQNPDKIAGFCRETLTLQATGLGERMLRCGAKKMVLGISGGLDSTLALVVLALVCRQYSLPPQSILAVTMPGFGTTGRTKSNAVKLAELIGAEIREISITDACMQHFSDIGHDPEKTDSVYENSQARERTQILMDIANQVNGIVIGTGDLSEIALGWSTFNGDQMAMYAVNSSIPKSNIAVLLRHAASLLPGSENILQDVIDTPVSPELLPLDANGEIAQKTEDILGAYELHDFYLYHFVNGVSAPEKLFALARHAFAGKYPDAELQRVKELFIRRFFTQQFKRTAAPDGIQAGEVSLSARTAWPMNADVSGALWRK